MVGTSVFRAHLDDARHIAAIVSLLDASALEQSERPLPQNARQAVVAALSEHCGVVAFLAFDRSEPVGVAVWVVRASKILGGRALLAVHDLAIHPDYRDDRADGVELELFAAADGFTREPAFSELARHALHAHAAPVPYQRVAQNVLGDAEIFVGAEITPETLVASYREGVFPWPMSNVVPWWSPDPRAIYPLGLPDDWSRSVRRAVRKPFRITVDTAFAEVLAGCADRQTGTWIDDKIKTAYTELHRLGYAHSVEVRNAETAALVGGIYGVAIGAAFSAESMFFRESDASKAAFVGLVTRLRTAGFQILDAQLISPHLASLGCVETPRESYLRALASVVDLRCVFPKE
jgi:leucyl/phenylalanyl-tRNA--protein transferase